MVLNSIRRINKKFKQEYGDLIICCDDRNYWRKDIQPYYKHRRKDNQNKGDIDFGEVFECLNKIREELKNEMPYKVIHVDRAEADDIIGTLVHYKGNILNVGEPIMISSSDKDYIQLQKYGNVKQYDSIRDRDIKHSDPEEYLYQHILKGDSSDDIPNVLSENDCFVNKVRQKPITKKRIEEFRDYDSLSEDMQRRIDRNRKLIDLSMVPDGIKKEIIDQYETPKKKRISILSYLMKHDLEKLMDNISEF